MATLPTPDLIPDFTPAYLPLLESGELARRVEQAYRQMEHCDLCGRYCRVDRRSSLKGVVCRTGEKATVDGFGPHHGEELPLRGRYGSGTIFFSWCNLRCVFCQNWVISHKGRGREMEPQEIADMMLSLQAQNCLNINLVSPSHVVAQILDAIKLAADQGLRLPIVYNSGGLDSLEALKLLDGVIDIFMPDMKYGDSAVARKYSGAKEYVTINQAAIREMHRQVGDLVLDDDGIAQRGLLVRHLVLPQGLAGTEQVLDFLAREISPDTYINLMDQYYPSYKADHYPELTRRISSNEFQHALDCAKRLGLNRLD
jgi:putative pyruvate formate lyase activating enzyme